MTRNYTYSREGNINTKVTEHGTYTYTYDDVYRLTNAVNPTITDETYTYDKLGNRLTSAALPGTWSYNYNNELTSYDTVSFAYDENGNTITKTVGTQNTSFVYDEADRMVEVKDHNGATTAAYYYDPFGRRLWKNTGSSRIYYLYSDEGLIGEYDSSGNEIKTYGYAIGSQWGTSPLFQRVGTGYYWYHNDHQGTPQKITDTTGAVVWSAVYDSFGRVTIETETITNNLRFPGQYYDTETGLHYNWHRYYDPETGRYMRVDPAGEGLNLYLYVQNNPLKYIDPEGLTTRSNQQPSSGGNGFNIVIGVSGSEVAALDPANPKTNLRNSEGSVGLVVNPGLGDSKADVGVFGSVGKGGGFNVGADLFVGVYKSQSIEGHSVNHNVVIGHVRVTATFDSNGNNFHGVAVGFGPAVPLGYSVSESITSSFTARDVLDKIDVEFYSPTGVLNIPGVMYNIPTTKPGIPNSAVNQ